MRPSVLGLSFLLWSQQITAMLFEGDRVLWTTFGNNTLDDTSPALDRRQLAVKPPRCKCSPVATIACNGQYKCQCMNEAFVNCWRQNRDLCEAPFIECKANGKPTLPTFLDGQYPPCAKTLPACRSGLFCMSLNRICIPWNGECLGVCVPNANAAGLAMPGASAAMQSPKQVPAQVAQLPAQVVQSPPRQAPKLPGWKPFSLPTAPQQQAPANAGINTAGFIPAPGNSMCPAGYKCPRQDDLCVPDPRKGGSYICGYPETYCGGLDKRTCASGLSCVKDPRENCVVNPYGGTCQGICV